MQGMHPPLALEFTTTVLVIVGAISVILLVLIIVAPWRKVRDEPPLDAAVEAKLLLHRNPDEPTGELPRIAGVAAGHPTEASETADFSELAELSDRDDD
jgi:hypothetical protein